MKERNRKASNSLAAAHLCIVGLLDRAATINNNMLSVTSTARRIIFSGHLT